MSLAAFALAAAVTAAPKPSIITHPDWARFPDGKAMAKAYPEAARDAGVEGAVVLRCHVAVTGSLRDCEVESETPAGQGFGAAGLKLSSQFQMKPWMRDGRAVEGGQIRVPLAFKLPPEPSGLTAEDMQHVIACYGLVVAAYDAGPDDEHLAYMVDFIPKAADQLGHELGMRHEDIVRLLNAAEAAPTKDEAVIAACWKDVEAVKRRRAANALR